MNNDGIPDTNTLAECQDAMSGEFMRTWYSDSDTTSSEDSETSSTEGLNHAVYIEGFNDNQRMRTQPLVITSYSSTLHLGPQYT